MKFEEVKEERMTRLERNKINNILNWRLIDFKNTDIFTRKVRALLQRKPNATLYTFYIVLKRGRYPLWREEKHILERYHIKRIIKDHKYTFFFAKETWDIEAYIKFLKMDITYYDVGVEGLKVFPYEYRYRLGNEDPARLHLSIEPDYDLVKAWIKLEAEIVKRYGYINAVKFLTFVRWKVFTATKYAYWDFKLLRAEHRYTAKRVQSKLDKSFDRFLSKNPDGVEYLNWLKTHQNGESSARYVLNYYKRAIKQKRRMPAFMLLTLKDYKESGFNPKKAYEKIMEEKIH